MTSLKGLFLSVTLLILFIGCGGSGGSGSTSNNPPIVDDPSNNSTTISGRVVDNYISGATVCIDSNKNNTCDAGEPTVTSDANGSFSFTQASLSNSDVIIAYGGTDAVTGEAFNYFVKNIVENKDSEDKIILSSINTLITDYKLLHDTDLTTAQNKIVDFLGGNSQNISKDFAIADVIENKVSQRDEFLRSLKLFQMVSSLNTIDNATESAKSFQDLAKFVKDNSAKNHDDNLSISKYDDSIVTVNATQYTPILFSNSSFNYYTDLSPTNQFSIEAYDPDGRALTYSLVDGKDKDDFNISSNVFSFKNVKTDIINPTDSNVDGYYQVDINISNGVTSIVKTFSVDVKYFNKSVKAVLANTNLSVEDNATLNTIIGAINVTSTGSNDKIIKYEEVSSNNYFDINNTNGNIFVEGNLSGLVTSGNSNTQTMEIRAKNSAGWSENIDVNIEVVFRGELNTTATIESTTFETIYENNASTQIVGSVTVASTGGHPVDNFNILSGNDNGYFAISSTGEINATHNFDFESEDTYTLGVSAYNTNGWGSPSTITVKIKDVNEAPTIGTSISDQTVSFSENKILNLILDDGDSVASQNISSIDVNSSNTLIATVSNSVSSGVDGDGLDITLTGVDTGIAQITLTLTDDGGIANGGINTKTYDFNVTVRSNGHKIYKEQKASNYTKNNVIFDDRTYTWSASDRWYHDTTNDTILVPVKIIKSEHYTSQNVIKYLEGHYYVNKNNYINHARIDEGTAHDVNNLYQVVDGADIKANNLNFQHDPLHNLFVSTIIRNEAGDGYESYTYAQWNDINSSDGSNITYGNAVDNNLSYTTDVNMSVKTSDGQPYASTSVIIDINNDGNITDSRCARQYGEGWRIPTSYEMGVNISSSDTYKGYIPAYVGHEDTSDIVSATKYEDGKHWILKSHSGFSRSGANATEYKIRCVYHP